MARADEGERSFLSKSMILPESSEDKSFPLVFKCAKCGQIIGDSLSWVCANDELETITLKNVTNKVLQGRTLMTSTEGLDFGSAYMLLKCEECGTELGKVYRTTPRHLDDLRELFSINLNQIDSYQVGLPEQEVSFADILKMCPSHSFLLGELKKLQQAVHTLENRLNSIEASAGCKSNANRLQDAEAIRYLPVDEWEDGNAVQDAPPVCDNRPKVAAVTAEKDQINNSSSFLDPPSAINVSSHDVSTASSSSKRRLSASIASLKKSKFS